MKVELCYQSSVKGPGAVFEKSVINNDLFSDQEFERLKTLTEQMSEAMGEDMVELPKLETEKDEEDEQVHDARGLIQSL